MNLLKYFSKTTFVVLLSRILGFVRDSLIAYFFGASYLTDAFFIAFRLPNFFRCIFSEGIFSHVFIPILSEYKKNKNKLFLKNFISHITGFLIFFMFFFVFFGILFSPFIINFISPGFSKNINYFDLSVYILRIIFPYILLISLISFYNSILNVWNYFFISSFTSVIFNVSMIFFIFVLKEYFSIKCLAFGVLFGGIFQILYQFFFLKKIDILVFPKISFYYTGILKLVKPIFPSILNIFIVQFSLTLNTIFISFLNTGIFSCIYYADRLIELPIGIFGVTLSNILLPILTENYLNKNIEKYNRLINLSLRICFLLGSPCAVGLIILSKPLIISFFQYGNFTNYNTNITQYILIFYSFGLLGSIISKILSSCFYSLKDIKTPVKISIFILLFVQLMNFIFFKIFKYLTLPFFFSIGSYLNAFFLYKNLSVNSIFILIGNWRKFFIDLILSLIIMSFVLFFSMYFFPISENQYFFSRIVNLFFIVFFGICGYFLSLFFLGFNFKKFFKSF